MVVIWALSGGLVFSADGSTEVALPKGVDPTTGFRMERYRSPVPDNLPGATVVTTGEAYASFAAGETIFIDVYPPRGLGPDPIDGGWVISESHETIKGATWLPEVGRGYLGQEHVDYFKRNLLLLTKEDLTLPLLFFCTADCWQSWNAARRALLWGHANVFWYPDGTDGWLEDGYSLVPATPVNFLGE